MNAKNLPLAAAIASAVLLTAGTASAFTLSKFKVSQPAKLNVPVVPDTTQKENPFSNDKLLDSRLPLALREEAQDWTTVEPDSLGNLNLVRPSDKPEIHTLTTRIRAERFAKGKLTLKSTAMADILVNGKSIAKKTNSDSIAGSVSGNVTLNPETDYTIQVNLLSMPGDKANPTFQLEFTPDKGFEDVTVNDGPDLSRRFSTRATMTGERAYATSLSPDGKYLLIKYSERHNARETTYRAVLQETASGKVIDSEANVYANWMPKGSTLYYTIHKPAGYEIHTTDIPSMKNSVIARGVPTSSFSFTPDAKSIIYYKNVDGSSHGDVMKRYTGPDDRLPGNRSRSYIMRYDLASRAVTTLTYGGATTSICDFTRDGKKMLYITSVNRPAEFPFYFKDLVEMDLTTLKTDTLIHNDGYINSAIYSPDAKKLFIEGSATAFNGIGLNIGKEEIANDFDGQGFIYDIATKQVTPSTKDFAPALQGGTTWNPTDNKIYFRGETGFDSYIYCLDPKTGKISKLDTKIEYAYNFSMGKDEKEWIAYTGGNFYDTGVAYLLNLKTGKTRLLDDPMQAELKGVEFGKMTPWKFTAKDGSEIDGYECLPPNFDPNKKYPLIVYYYGGTSPSTASITTPYSPQVFASRGYVVYVLNPSGTTGYGQEFAARHVNAWGKRTADEIIEGVKKFCKAHPFVDEKKIGCIGASYGGFMTQYLQTKTDIFAAAVSHAGISNVTSYWGEGFWGYSYDAVAAAKSYPWNNPDLFTKQGSLFNADKIKTPLLLLHGTVDTNVPIGESIQLFNALKILGRDVEFITVEGENHVITDFDKKMEWQNTIMAWFAKYLQGDSRWWDSLYGK